MQVGGFLESLTPDQKLECFNCLLIDPDISDIVEEKLLIYFNMFLATSELRPLKRIAELESKLGLDDEEDHETENEPTSERPIRKGLKEGHIRKGQAVELVNFMKTKVKPRMGETFLTPEETQDFLKNTIEEKYRVHKEQWANIRKIKKEVIEKAKELYPDTVFLRKKRTGKKEVTIIYKN